MKKIKAGIVGAAGYTGGELLRLLNTHPHVETLVPLSRTHHGSPVSLVHTDLYGDIDACFSDRLDGDEDVIFLCLPHGESKKWLSENKISSEQLVIDLGQDFRLQRGTFAYGLSEINPHRIAGATRIANPGCFATLIQLMLVPLAANNLLPQMLEVAATTGSTGAGVTPGAQTHFSWRAGNHSAYKSLAHQHLAEITETFCAIQSGWSGQINMIPFRGSFTRGIHAVIHFETTRDESFLLDVFRKQFAGAPFVHITTISPDVKQVVNTNKCFIHLEKVNDRLVITGVIDNLLKGASGQAVQNMNIALGLPETTGLKLKALAY